MHVLCRQNVGVILSLKALNEEHQRFVEATKVYIEAKKFIEQAVSYARFGKLDVIYGNAVSVQ